MKAIQKIKSNLSKIIKVLRHGILSLYSYIRKFVPWRSRTYIQNLRHVRTVGLTSSFLLGLLALAIIIPLYNVSGTEDTEAASSYVPSTSSITFTSTRNKASINLTPTSTTGTFVQSDTANTSEVASFNVTTNNATGYTLGIASSTNTTSLTNGTDTLPTITNASTGITASTFNTSTYNDMWGYLPSKYNSTANTGSSAKFYPMTTTTATLDETTAANSTANTYTIALGARVTMSKSSGTYTTPTGTAFILSAVGKPASYSITYIQNTTDSVSNLPGPTGTQSTSAQSITLSSTTPARTNYNFLGWCTAQLSDQANGTSGSTACSNANGTYYAAGGTFYIDETTKNVTTIYAMWESAMRYMQDLTLSECKVNIGTNGNPANIGDPITVIDRRDGQIYTVRYINGGCWMTRNLAIGCNGNGASYGASISVKTLTSAESNVSSTWATPSALLSAATANNETENYTTPRMQCSATRGAWYNYAAASAGTVVGESNTNETTNDICPAGWQLPNGPNTAVGTYINTLVGNSTSAWQSVTTGISAFNPVPGGSYYQGSIANEGWGLWWTSSPLYSPDRHILIVNTSTNQLYGDGNSNRPSGEYVRCVKKGDYMQDQNIASLNTLLPNVNDTAILRDARDEKNYRVAKLADNNYWMIQNLNIARGTTLTPTLSDVASNYTLNTTFDGQSGVYNDAKYGGYYGWTAATAGTSKDSGYQAAPSSICPKGWRLPTAHEFQNFNNFYSTKEAISASPLFFSADGGRYQSSGLTENGTRSNWWARDAFVSSNNGGTYAFILSVFSSQAPTSNSGYSFGAGNFIRCIFGEIPSYTINLSKVNATGIKIDGVNYTGNSVTLKAGVHSIEGIYGSNYEFSSWNVSGSITQYQSTKNSSGIMVYGAGTVTLTGKSSKLWFQNATSEDCGKTMYDNRGNDTYKNIAYTTAKIGSLCWMTRNLDLPGGTTLSSSDTNLTNGFTLPASSTSGFSSQNTDYVYNSSSTYNDTSCGDNNPCYSYYSFYTATAHWGTDSVSSGNSSVDICPKGWRLPTKAEYDTLKSSYNTGAKLTTSPFYGVYSGIHGNGSFYYGGSYGRYWSSTVYNANNAYTLLFDSSSANTSYNDKNGGFAVRCVAKDAM